VSSASKPRVLCVDDEPNVLESLRDTLRKRFDVVVTTNGFEALRMLKEERFEVLVSDMRMPMINGARFLSLAREHAPDTVRLLLTGQSALDDAVAAINDGEIFRFLVKPCETANLKAALDAGVTRHRALVGQRELEAESARETARALIAVACALDPTVPERSERIARNARELCAATESFVPTPELQPAVDLMQLGVVAASKDTLAQMARGQRLNREQAVEIERLPEVAHPFLLPIPSLRPVAVLLAAMTEPFVATVPGVAGTPIGARILRIAVDFEALECQGVPAHTALRTMEARDRRYDPAILSDFADVLGIT
jgi:response regulator RpfG family c-di-GMP phosphodiesterase